MIIRPELIGAFFTGVLGPLVVTFVKDYLEKRKLNKKDPVAESLKTNILVDNKVNEILEEYSADRVWITQFHNGGHFYPTGKSIHKFSMFYETVVPGTTSIKDYFQNIPVSLFSKSTNYLLENEVIEIADFKDETIATHGLKYIADEYGCKSGYLFAIKTIEYDTAVKTETSTFTSIWTVPTIAATRSIKTSPATRARFSSRWD
jgi:hypothetical protein